MRGSSTRTVRVRTPQAEALTTELLRLGAVINPNNDGALVVTGTTAPEIGHAAFAAGIELHELVEERPDLEDVFLQLTQGLAGIR